MRSKFQVISVKCCFEMRDSIILPTEIYRQQHFPSSLQIYWKFLFFSFTSKLSYTSMSTFSKLLLCYEGFKYPTNRDISLVALSLSIAILLKIFIYFSFTSKLSYTSLSIFSKLMLCKEGFKYPTNGDISLVVLFLFIVFLRKKKKFLIHIKFITQK